MLTDELECCGLLWCFYQLFGLSFWRHPFTAEHPLLIHWWRDTFLQTWWRNKLIYILDDLRVSTLSFLVNFSFNPQEQHVLYLFGLNELLCDYVNAVEGDSKGVSESVSVGVFVWVQTVGLMESDVCVCYLFHQEHLMTGVQQVFMDRSHMWVWSRDSAFI